MQQLKQATRYPIIGVFNEREHGKTTFAVKYIITQINSSILYDEAYTNIHVGPKVKEENGKMIHYGHPKIHFINYADLMKLRLPTINGTPRAIVLLDQIPNYIDARASNTKLNIEFTKWIRESRQHGLDIIYTTWMRSEVDKRMRPFTNLLVSAYRTAGGFLYKQTVRKPDAIMRLPNARIPWSQVKVIHEWFDSTELIEDETIPK